MVAQTTVATRPLRIAIDYTSAINQNAGIGRFVRNLVNAVVTNDTTDAFLLLHAAPNPGRTPNYPGGSNVSHRVLRVNERWTNIIWHRLQVPLPADWLTGPVDLFHSPDFVLPPVRAARSILTVHDLAFLLYPECADASLRAYLEKTVPRSVQRADYVVADSENTRNDVICLLGRAARAGDRRAWRRRSGLQAGDGPGPAGGVPSHARPRSRHAVHPLHRRDRAAQEPDGPDRGVRHPEVAPSAAAQARRGRPARLALRRRRWTAPSARRTGATSSSPASSRKASWRRSTRPPRRSRSRPTTRGSGCRSWRRWPAARPSSHRAQARCRRSSATPACRSTLTIRAAGFGAGAAGAQPGDAGRLPRARHRAGGGLHLGRRGHDAGRLPQGRCWSGEADHSCTRRPVTPGRPGRSAGALRHGSFTAEGGDHLDAASSGLGVALRTPWIRTVSS